MSDQNTEGKKKVMVENPVVHHLKITAILKTCEKLPNF
jgi:hypothetical protein